MEEEISKISDLLNDAYCLIKSAKDSCEMEDKVHQAVTLDYATKILDRLRDRLDLL